jgi:hypothetical protein
MTMNNEPFGKMLLKALMIWYGGGKGEIDSSSGNQTINQHRIPLGINHDQSWEN